MEYEADALGMVYMKKAGYDANGAIDAMKRLEKLTDEEKQSAVWREFLSTHPSTSKRYVRLKKLKDLDAGRVFEAVTDDDGDIMLDWSLEAEKMLEDIRIVSKPCENSEGDVLFVPGIFVADSEKYLPVLAEAFPNHTVRVLHWKAVHKLSWRRAVYRAKILSGYLSKILQQESREELQRQILVGHSLGTQVVIQSAEKLAQNDGKLQRIVLLGSASPFDFQALKECEKVSMERPINLFNPLDRVLKYVFFFYENKPALGLMGAKERLERFAEYRMPSPQEEDDENRDELSTDEDYAGDEKTLHISDGMLKSHKAVQYLEYLSHILKDGEHCPCETLKIDHTQIAEPVIIKKAIPRKGAKIFETYCDWEFVGVEFKRFRFYGIRNPYGQWCGFGVNREKVSQKFNEIKAKLDEKMKMTGPESVKLENSTP